MYSASGLSLFDAQQNIQVYNIYNGSHLHEKPCIWCNQPAVPIKWLSPLIIHVHAKKTVGTESWSVKKTMSPLIKGDSQSFSGTF